MAATTGAKPVIGITRCSRLDDYVASVEGAGGRARVLEIGESPRALIEQLDGLLLTGGGDIDPALYGEDRHPDVDDAEPGRDEFEIDLARRSMNASLPLLAICRGAQVLNVAAGGTLIQDIPSALKTDVPHRLTEPKDAVAHEVSVAPGTKLQRALGERAVAGTVPVNSRHHQSVGRLGEGLRQAASAADGIVEAIESAADGYCIGVQWHPENFWRTGEFAPLFQSFVAAARARMRRVAPPTPS
jgi:putative glutamine amidotransferase